MAWLNEKDMEELSQQGDELHKIRELVKEFLKDFWELRIMDDVAVRDPPSKHQRKLRQLCDMVRAFEHEFTRNTVDDLLKNNEVS